MIEKTQLLFELADKKSMSIQAISNQPMTVLESTFARENVNTQIAVAVMKQIQNTQKSQAQALVQMINQSTPEGTGGLVNIVDLMTYEFKTMAR